MGATAAISHLSTETRVLIGLDGCAVETEHRTAVKIRGEWYVKLDAAKNFDDAQRHWGRVAGYGQDSSLATFVREVMVEVWDQAGNATPIPCRLLVKMGDECWYRGMTEYIDYDAAHAVRLELLGGTDDD